MPSDIMSDIQTAVNSALDDLGHGADAARQQMADFLTEIQPDVDEAIALNDTLSLGFIRDRISIKLARIALGTMDRDQKTIIAVNMTVIRLAIMWGV